MRRRALVFRPTENVGWDADLCTYPYPLCALVRNSLQQKNKKQRAGKH